MVDPGSLSGTLSCAAELPRLIMPRAAIRMAAVYTLRVVQAETFLTNFSDGIYMSLARESDKMTMEL